MVSRSIRIAVARWLHARSQTSVWTILVTYLVVVACLGFVLGARTINGTPIPNLTRDPQAVAALPVHTGFLSNVGVILWSATAAVCLFGFAILRERQVDTTTARFLLVGGLITSMLLIDDLFMMHDAVFPRYFGSINEIFYASYALMVAVYLVWFHRTILRTDFLLLALAFAGFGMSIALDSVHWFSMSSDVLFFVEDGSKFFGIALWSAYFMTVSARAVARPHVVDEATVDATP